MGSVTRQRAVLYTLVFCYAAVAAVGGVMVGCEPWNALVDQYVVDNYYEDVAEARSSNAISSTHPQTTQWLPGLIPECAADIRERHSLDTNELWVTFAFETPLDEDRLPACHRVPIKSVRFPRNPNALIGGDNIDWWPSDLRERRELLAWYDFYSCYGETESGYFSVGGITRWRAWLAVDPAEKRAYYWETR